MPVKTEPKTEPKIEPGKVEPRVDPNRRLIPDRFCPSQGDEVVKRIREI